MEMKRNLERLDRIVRGLVAIAIVVIYMLGVLEANNEIILISTAGLLLWTCVFGFCPLYMAFSIRTNRRGVNSKE